MDIEFLKQLCSANAVAGQEDAARDLILARIAGKCECSVDSLGNILAFKKGKRRPKHKLLFSAHMDEVGFIITSITPEGLLKFASVGGIDSRVIVGKPVLVGKNHLPGVIGTKAVHLQSKEEKETVLTEDKLTIDIGATSKEDAEKLVALGDLVAFDSAFFEMGGGLLKAKALDDRAGCALLVDLIESNLIYDCHFAFTVSEEIGAVGSKTAAFATDTEYAIVVETTTAADIGGVPTEKQVCRLKHGPVVAPMDKGAVYDKELYALALEIAKKRSLPIQVKEGVYGGNDSRSIQVSRVGVKVLAVSLACRYLHSPACVIAAEDYDSTLKLLQALAGEICKR